MREPECTDFSGLAGFGGGFHIEIAGEYLAERVRFEDNTFSENEGLLVDDVYFELFNRASLSTMDTLQQRSDSNSYQTSTRNESEWTRRAMGSSPVYFGSVELVDGSVSGDGKDDECLTDDCIGYVLPGDTLFRASFSLVDFFSQRVTPFLACSHFVYNLSLALELHQMTLQYDGHLSVELGVSEAQFETKEFINITDTHRVLTSNVLQNATYRPATYHVVTTLCSSGQEVSVSTEGVDICSKHDMATVSFKCGRQCGQQEYLFTRWEPSCHSCPEGVS